MTRARAFAIIAGCAGIVAVGMPAAAVAAAAPATTSLLQASAVTWKNGKSAGHDRATFSVPGIGSGDLVCRRNAILFRITPSSTAPETTMWSTLSQVKNGETSYAVHDARVYTFSTPTSTVPHGTGVSAREGLNLWTPVENSGSGSAFGVISQRSALNVPATGQPAATAFKVQWSWSGFATPARSRCSLSIALDTPTPPNTQVLSLTSGPLVQGPGPAANGFAVDWHGEADAPGKTTSAPVQIPYLGAITATCPTGHDAAASWSLQADDPASGVVATVETDEGEGTDASSTTTYAVDPATGAIDAVPLPVNGMERVTLWDGQHRATITLSSLRKTNDPNPAENVCEIAGESLSARW